MAPCPREADEEDLEQQSGVPWLPEAFLLVPARNPSLPEALAVFQRSGLFLTHPALS